MFDHEMIYLSFTFVLILGFILSFILSLTFFLILGLILGFVFGLALLLIFGFTLFFILSVVLGLTLFFISSVVLGLTLLLILSFVLGFTLFLVLCGTLLLKYDKKDFNTSYLTDSYIGFTLNMESVSKNIIFGLKMMVKSGLEKSISKSLHAGR